MFVAVLDCVETGALVTQVFPPPGTGNNKVSVSDGGTGPEIHPLRHGPGESQAGAGNGFSQKSSEQRAIPPTPGLQHHCELHEPVPP